MSKPNDGGPAFPRLTRSSHGVYSIHEDLLSMSRCRSHPPRPPVALPEALQVRANANLCEAQRKGGSYPRATCGHGSAGYAVPNMLSRHELANEGRIIHSNNSSARQMWRHEADLPSVQHAPCVIRWRPVLRSRWQLTPLPTMQGNTANRVVLKGLPQALEEHQHLLPQMPRKNARGLGKNQPKFIQ